MEENYCIDIWEVYVPQKTMTKTKTKNIHTVLTNLDADTPVMGCC